MAPASFINPTGPMEASENIAAVNWPPKHAPVSIFRRFAKSSGFLDLVGECPWITKTPWSLSEDRNGSRIQRRSSSDCDDSGTPGRRCAPTINSPAREKGGSAFVPDGLVHEGKLARRPRRARALALIQDARSRQAPVEPAVSRFLLGQHPHSHSPDQHCQVPRPAERCQQSHDRPS